MASAKAPWRRETELFSSGTEGYHTFRIPSVAVANDGTILAICEGRKDGQDDYEAKALVVKRSTDNGATWGDLNSSSATLN
jgi:sialidase-1